MAVLRDIQQTLHSCTTTYCGSAARYTSDLTQLHYNLLWQRCQIYTRPYTAALLRTVAALRVIHQTLHSYTPTYCGSATRYTAFMTSCVLPYATTVLCNPFPQPSGYMIRYDTATKTECLTETSVFVYQNIWRQNSADLVDVWCKCWIFWMPVANENNLWSHEINWMSVANENKVWSHEINRMNVANESKGWSHDIHWMTVANESKWWSYEIYWMTVANESKL